MVWVVEPREVRDALGVGRGQWRLCAFREGTGELYVGCHHEHRTAQASIDCTDAQMIVRAVTDAPRLYAPPPAPEWGR